MNAYVPSLISLTALLAFFSLFHPVLLLAQQGPASDTIYVDLTSAIRSALDGSPEVQDVESSKAFAAARYNFARSSQFLPDLQLTTGHSLAPGLKGVEEGTSTDALYLDPDVANDWDNLGLFTLLEAEAIQPIYTWGELSNNIKAARSGIDVEEASVRDKESEIALRTGELFINLLLTEELYRLTDRIGDVLNQAKDEINRLLLEGDEDVDDADLFQVQISEQEFFRRVVEVDQQREVARSALKRQLNLPEESIVVPERSILEPIAFTLDSLDTYIQIALANRPELAQARAGRIARSALLDVAKSNFFPKLFVGFTGRLSYAEGRFRQPSPYVGDPFRGRSFTAGLGIRQNLNFLQTRARVDQARAELNQVGYQQEAAHLLILFEVEEAYRNFIIQNKALEAQDESLRISRNWLMTEMNNFDFDLGDTENLVRAVQVSLQLEAAYYEAVRTFNVSILRLLDTCGILVQESQAGTLVE